MRDKSIDRFLRGLDEVTPGADRGERPDDGLQDDSRDTAHGDSQLLTGARDPEGSGEQGVYLAIRSAAAKSSADSFGPYFADRVVRKTFATKASRRWQVGSWRPRRLVAPAALIAGVIALLIIVQRPQVEYAPAGSVIDIALSDDSKVTLAPGSTLQWRPFGLRSRRAVSLTGEAFFDVAAGSKPFTVETSDALITVLGTRFNVRAWPGAISNHTIVALEEGRVEMTGADGSMIVLSPGETVQIGSSAAPEFVKQALTPDVAASWRSGGLVFDDRPLGDVFDDLERRFGITIEAPEALVTGRNATYVNSQAAHIEEVLDAVCFALDLRYRPIRGGFRIESNR